MAGGKKERHLQPVPSEKEPLEILGKVPGTGFYCALDGRFYRKERNGYVPVENLEKIRVSSLVRVEGGEEGRRVYYEITVGEKTVFCSWDEMRRGTVWEEFSGNMPLGSAGAGVASLANLVDFLAVKAPQVSGHTSTGWQSCTVGGKSFFGYVLPNSSVLGSEESRGRVHMVGVSEATRDAYDALEDVERAGKREVGEALSFVQDLTSERGQALLILGAAARALAFGVERAGVAVVVEGESGTGKSSLAGLARSLTAPYSYPPKPDLTFSDTVTRMEVALDRLGSMPMLIDDLALLPDAAPKDVKDAQQKLERIIRPLFNDAPMRQRMRRDMKEQRSYKAGTIPIFTTEGLPPVLNSLLRRSLLITLEEGDTDLRLIRESAHHVKALRALGVGVIEELSSRIEKSSLKEAAGEIVALRETYAEHLRELLEARLGRPIPQVCESLPTNAAEVLVGLSLLENAAGPEGGGNGLVKQGTTHMVGVLEEQVLRMEGKDDEDRSGPFSQLMRELLAHVESGAALPELGGRAGRIGDYSASAGLSDEAPAVPIPGGPGNYPASMWGVAASENEKLITVAYADPRARCLYLDPTGRRVLRALAAKTPGCEGIATDKAMTKAAENEGWIKRRGEGRQAATRIGPRGQQRRALALSLDLYLDTEESSEKDNQPPPEYAGKTEESSAEAPANPADESSEVPELWEEHKKELEEVTFGKPPPEQSPKEADDTGEPAPAKEEDGPENVPGESPPATLPEENQSSATRETLISRVRKDVEADPKSSKVLQRCMEGRMEAGPIASTLAYNLYATASRHKEVLPFVEEQLREERPQ